MYINVEYSWKFQETFFPRQDYQKLQQESNILQQTLNKHGNQIQSKIKHNTGLTWKHENLTVWLFKGSAPSISKPVMINTLHKNQKTILFLVIHELHHVILRDTVWIKNIEPRYQEALINTSSKHIFEKITKTNLTPILDSVGGNTYHKEAWQIATNIGTLTKKLPAYTKQDIEYYNDTYP